MFVHFLTQSSKLLVDIIESLVDVHQYRIRPGKLSLNPLELPLSVSKFISNWTLERRQPPIDVWRCGRFRPDHLSYLAALGPTISQEQIPNFI
jgi:hypothetical protein